jgi:hypothetical protein
MNQGRNAARKFHIFVKEAQIVSLLAKPHVHHQHSAPETHPNRAVARVSVAAFTVRRARLEKACFSTLKIRGGVGRQVASSRCVMANTITAASPCFRAPTCVYARH